MPGRLIVAPTQHDPTGSAAKFGKSELTVRSIWEKIFETFSKAVAPAARVAAVDCSGPPLCIGRWSAVRLPHWRPWRATLALEGEARFELAPNQHNSAGTKRRPREFGLSRGNLCPRTDGYNENK
jgi:hypothetical protein